MRVNDFSLQHTVESGQFFQFERQGQGYVIWVGDDIFYAEQQGNKLGIMGVPENRAVHILGLDEDYSGILKSISKEKYIKEAIACHPGMRNMRQQFYECLIAYVCSANSNIPKIAKNVKLLSRFYGKTVQFRGKQYSLFPKPGVRFQLDKVLEAKTGFRAKYICAVNKIVDEAWINRIKAMPYEEAKAMLMELPGVGPKIADCVCLFSLGHTQAFPVDVWIRRAMTEQYFHNQSVKDEQIQRFAMKHFDKFAGYAGQFLFYSRRKQ